MNSSISANVLSTLSLQECLRPLAKLVAHLKLVQIFADVMQILALVRGVQLMNELVEQLAGSVPAQVVEMIGDVLHAISIIKVILKCAAKTPHAEHKPMPNKQIGWG